jgi:Tol biopolymer transport system component
MMNKARFMVAGVVLSSLIWALGAALPASATFKGKNGRLAFRQYFNDAHTYGAIFTINPDGTGLRQVTHPRKGVLHDQADWSPNGRWIAFQRVGEVCTPSECPRDRLFKVRADGGDLTQLDKGLGCSPSYCPGDYQPAWSPSGKKIAFYRDTGGGAVVGLFVMRTDGTHTRQVTEKFTPTKYEDYAPQWSPDGDRLVFQRFNKATGLFAVFTVRLDGTHDRRLTPWNLGAGGNPDWSPDGRWILFQSHIEDGKPRNVCVVHPNGTDLHCLTHATGTTSFLRAGFSPDGTKIVTAMVPGMGAPGNAGVFVMNVDGTDLHDVTNTVRWDSGPDWGSKP